MSAVVRVTIEGPAARKLQTTAVLNGGFSSSTPHVLLPWKAALILYPDYPSGMTPIGAKTAGGRVAMREAKERVSVQVLTDNRVGPVALCVALVSEQEDEVLLSDYAIDSVGVKIERHGDGLWRFADETAIRPSEARQSW